IEIQTLSNLNTSSNENQGRGGFVTPPSPPRKIPPDNESNYSVSQVNHSTVPGRSPLMEQYPEIPAVWRGSTHNIHPRGSAEKQSYDLANVDLESCSSSELQEAVI